MTSRRLGAIPGGAGARRGILLGPLAAILAACGLFADDPEVPTSCPRAEIPGGADVTASYRTGATRNPSALRYAAALSRLQSSCRDGAGNLEVDLAFDVIAERGPELGGAPVDVTYFVAVVGPDGRIQSKQLFNTQIDVEAGRATGGIREDLTLRLPGVTPAEARPLRIYIGFQRPRPDDEGPSLLRQ